MKGKYITVSEYLELNPEVKQSTLYWKMKHKKIKCKKQGKTNLVYYKEEDHD